MHQLESQEESLDCGNLLGVNSWCKRPREQKQKFAMIRPEYGLSASLDKELGKAETVENDENN